MPTETRKYRPAIIARLARAGQLAPVAAALLVLFLGGCTSWRDYVHNGFKVGPNYRKPAAPVAPDWIEAHSPGVNVCSPDLREWWQVFDDPKLNQLVEIAYRQNLTVRTAGARILEARALRNIAAGNLFPQTQNATGSYQRTAISRTTAFNNLINSVPAPGFPGIPGSFDQWSAGFNLSWELDFWGRFRRAIEAADANFDASIENYDNMLVLLIGDVAGTYIQLRTFQERIRFAAENIAIQAELTEKAENRVKAGVANSPLDLAQMRSNLTDTKALKEELELGLRLANNRLCVLLGLPVQDLLPELGDVPIPTTPLEVIVGVPADLLRRRPDVREAERQVAARSAEIGIAVSDLYPHISIIGTLGWQAEKLPQLFTSQSLNGNVGPSFQWNILNYGRIVNNIRAQDARFQQAAWNYQNLVLSAGREVEDGMAIYVKAQRRANELNDSARDAKEAVRVVQDLIKDAKFDINRVFVTSNFLVTQQDKLAQARGDIALGLIQVYRSLGGGWQIRLQDVPLKKRGGIHGKYATVAEPTVVGTVMPGPLPAGTTPVEALPLAPGPAFLPAVLGQPQAASAPQ